MKSDIIDAHSSYDFADYFRLSLYLDKMLAYFGYHLHKTQYDLPRSAIALERLADLTARLQDNLPHINLTNGTA